MPWPSANPLIDEAIEKRRMAIHNEKVANAKKFVDTSEPQYMHTPMGKANPKVQEMEAEKQYQRDVENANLFNRLLKIEQTDYAQVLKPASTRTTFINNTPGLYTPDTGGAPVIDHLNYTATSNPRSMHYRGSTPGTPQQGRSRSCSRVNSRAASRAASVVADGDLGGDISDEELNEQVLAARAEQRKLRTSMSGSMRASNSGGDWPGVVQKTPRPATREHMVGAIHARMSNGGSVLDGVTSPGAAQVRRSTSGVRDSGGALAAESSYDGGRVPAGVQFTASVTARDSPSRMGMRSGDDGILSGQNSPSNSRPGSAASSRHHSPAPPTGQRPNAPPPQVSRFGSRRIMTENGTGSGLPPSMSQDEELSGLGPRSASGAAAEAPQRPTSSSGGAVLYSTSSMGRRSARFSVADGSFDDDVPQQPAMRMSFGGNSVNLIDAAVRSPYLDGANVARKGNSIMAVRRSNPGIGRSPSRRGSEAGTSVPGSPRIMHRMPSNRQSIQCE